MYKVLKTRIKLDKNQHRLLKLMSHVAKNIYNISLYELRQHYFRNQDVLSYYQIKDLIKSNPNYKLLHPYISASIINEVIKALKLYTKYHNFDGSVKSYYINNTMAETYSFPKYKKKNSYFTISFIIESIRTNKHSQSYDIPISYSFLNNYVFKHSYNDKLLDKFISQSHLKQTPNLEITLPRNLYNKNIKSVKLVPKANGEVFELQYLYEIKAAMISYKGTEDMAIDLGVGNLATCITTNLDSFIIDGKKAKSIIRLYNVELAKAKKNQPFIPNTNKTRQLQHSKYINSLYLNYEAKMYNYINTSVNILLKRAIKNNVGRIILGWNDGFKKNGIVNSNISKKTKAAINQSFLAMPLAKFRETLNRKASIYGIRLVITDEKYTSKVSFYDNEPLNYHDYWGERIQRGLFMRPNGRKLNADINGALNIYRKFIVTGSSNTDKLNYMMSSGILTPDRVRVLNHA